jgi:hypothetical protein
MAKLQPEFHQLTEADIEAIVRIGREQAVLMDQLAEALAAADTLRLYGVARELVGLEQKVREQ